ncbi:YkgJ family cysteine cluster protein [Geobacter sp. DSM 9736]|uniref:YkgJ family cysteine cluster protein n=1 Tax=Geobacter sp. DSM 9736 TaxID=1277350 RepID=UPI000B50186F|nr:YkgJ family cysteine cluster protein [Geobacter sp. DSM 9736]SNB45591.1 Putative zinc- or iron-chelating domain-containing protein [Geobacter sp. DSM 9736]
MDLSSLATIINAYQDLLASVDKWFAVCTEAAADEISCRKGCSECCRGLFDITLLDAVLLKQGFDLLPDEVRRVVLARSQDRLRHLRFLWPEFSHPYILNLRPEADWETLMPDDDETPCPLLGENGSCLVYSHRPMTCRLHGLPLVDLSGEVLHEEWCTLNFTGSTPLLRPELRGDFNRFFQKEVSLLQVFAQQLIKKKLSELDTFIPTALMIDYATFDWEVWGASAPIVPNDPC